MTTRLSTKLAALGVALLVNGALVGGVAYLFSAHLHQSVSLGAAPGAASRLSVMPTI
jgi:hypothetical protein